MKYTRKWCFGDTERRDLGNGSKDFVTDYIAEDGTNIRVLFWGNSVSGYRVTSDGVEKVFRTLKEAKAFVEREKVTAPIKIQMNEIVKELQSCVDFMKGEKEHQKEWGYSSVDFANEQFSHFFSFADRLLRPYGLKATVINWKVQIVER